MTERRTLLLFGDSNTWGAVPVGHPDDRRLRHPERQRWPGVLAAALGTGWRVVDEGRSGRTTVHDDPIEGVHRNGLRALPVCLESHRPLDVVAILLGTNDLKSRFAVTGAEIALALERLAQAVLASGTGPGDGAPGLLLIAPPPILETGWTAPFFVGGAAKSAALAPLLAGAARRLGVAFLDAGATIASDPADGIHWNAAAHGALGAAVARAITEHWP